MKRYNDLNTSLRDIFGKKVVKLSLNGGFSCPDRTGGGCFFCDGSGSGEFASSPGLDIGRQIEDQISFLSKKWKSGGYIAYFGTYTSTYGDIGHLKAVCDEALSYDCIDGLALSTRPDCVGDDVISLLKYYDRKTFLWTELGFQTVHDSTHLAMNTGYTSGIFFEACEKMKRENLRYVPHVIFGLPGETQEMMLDSINAINHVKPWGVKIHMLYILYTSHIYKMYLGSPFDIMGIDEYTDLVAKALGILDNSIIIHRLTGDPPRKKLFGPAWTIDKRRVLQTIEKKLVTYDIVQGKNSMII